MHRVEIPQLLVEILGRCEDSNIGLVHSPCPGKMPPRLLMNEHGNLVAWGNLAHQYWEYYWHSYFRREMSAWVWSGLCDQKFGISSY